MLPWLQASQAWLLLVAWQRPAHPAEPGTLRQSPGSSGVADRRIAFFILALVWASPALAQTTTEPIPDPSAEAPIRFGPLSLKSTIALSNIGIDTNVFNAASND